MRTCQPLGILWVFICLLITGFSSCKKNNCTAGSGGNIVVKASIVHHTVGIKGATLFIKYCAQDLPGQNSSDYDTNVKGNNSDTTITITGLMAGDYYFYGAGFDSTIFDNVNGGIPLNLSETSDTVRVTVYVVE